MKEKELKLNGRNKKRKRGEKKLLPFSSTTNNLKRIKMPMRSLLMSTSKLRLRDSLR